MNNFACREGVSDKKQKRHRPACASCARIVNCDLGYRIITYGWMGQLAPCCDNIRARRVCDVSAPYSPEDWRDYVCLMTAMQFVEQVVENSHFSVADFPADTNELPETVVYYFPHLKAHLVAFGDPLECSTSYIEVKIVGCDAVAQLLDQFSAERLLVNMPEEESDEYYGIRLPTLSRTLSRMVDWYL